jgi:glycosyltransferase involved in cell wall biosynthesis
LWSLQKLNNLSAAMTVFKEKEKRPRLLSLFLSSFRAGGGEKQMVEIANALAKRGERVDLVVIKPVGALTDAVSSGVQVVSLDRGRIALSLLPLLAYLWRERPVAVLATDEYSHLLVLIGRMLTRVNTRVVLRVGNMLTELAARYKGKSVLLPFLIRRLYKKADAVIANSQGVAADFAVYARVPPARIKVIYNPKPLAEIRRRAQEPTGQEWLDAKTVPVVLGVGRLREQKNFSLLIRAFARVAAEMPCRLVIVGVGREEPRLRALVAELGLEQRVLFAGYTDNPYAYMAKADLFAAASLWEGMPNSLMEAMACGVPVIAADCPSGPRELLAPNTDYAKRLTSGLEQAQYGVLTAVNDEEALVAALRLMLSDPPLRQEYAGASRERSAAFEAKDAIDKYMEVLGI